MITASPTRSSIDELGKQSKSAQPQRFGNALLRTIHNRFRRPLIILRYDGSQFESMSPPAAGTVPSTCSDPFILQMRYLADRCNLLPLSRIAWYLSGKLAMPARPVVVTFDCGSSASVGRLLPVLRGLGMPATVFLAAQVGLEGFRGFQGLQGLQGLEELDGSVRASLASAGIEFGSSWQDDSGAHELNSRVRVAAMADSKAQVEAATGASINALAYRERDVPANDETIFAAALAGYRLAVTRDQRVNWLGALSPMTLSRITVAPDLPIAAFRRLIDFPAWESRLINQSLSDQA